MIAKWSKSVTCWEYRGRRLLGGGSGWRLVWAGEGAGAGAERSVPSQGVNMRSRETSVPTASQVLGTQVIHQQHHNVGQGGGGGGGDHGGQEDCHRKGLHSALDRPTLGKPCITLVHFRPAPCPPWCVHCCQQTGS